MNIIEKQTQLQKKAEKKGITITLAMTDEKLGVQKDEYKITFQKHGLSFSMVFGVNGSFISIRTTGKKYVITVLSGECFSLAEEFLDSIAKEREIYLYDLYDNSSFQSFLTEKKKNKYCTTKDWFEHNEEVFLLANEKFPLMHEYMHYVMKKENQEMIERYFLFPGELDACMHTITSTRPTLVYKKVFDFLKTSYFMDIQHHGKQETIRIKVMPNEYQVKTSQKLYTGERLVDVLQEYFEQIEKEMRLKNLYTPDVYHLTEALEKKCTKEQIDVIYTYLKKRYTNQEIELQAMEFKKENKELGIIDEKLIITRTERVEVKWHQFLNVQIINIGITKNGTLKKMQSIIGEEAEVIERYEKEVVPMMHAMLNPNRKEVVHEGA